MSSYLNDSSIEALVFDFIHFYGNANSFLDSPGWYRSEARIIKSSIRSYAPDGLFWLVLDKNKKGRYPKAKKVGVSCYHYGWIRSEQQMNLKSQKVQKYWGKEHINIDYSQIDSSIIKLFDGSHPSVMKDWISKTKGIFVADKSYKLSKKDLKHRIMKKIESFCGVELSKKHYKLVK